MELSIQMPVGYMSRFIPNFSQIAEPLKALTRLRQPQFPVGTERKGSVRPTTVKTSDRENIPGGELATFQGGRVPF